MEMSVHDRIQHPRQSDPQEQRIRRLIEGQAYVSDFGRRVFSDAKKLQVDYFKKALSHLGHKELVYDETQNVLRDLSLALHSQIISGRENLKDIPKGSPIIAFVNHYGGFKLTMIDQKELGVKIDEMEDIPPFPLYYSSVMPVAAELQDDLCDVHLSLPGDLGRVQEAAGTVVVPLKKSANDFSLLIDRTEENFSKHRNSVCVVFPEGQTSGKRSERGPYDLEPYQSGFFAIASKLGVIGLPIAQCFNPNKGMELAVFAPILPNPNATREDFDKVAADTQRRMQEWLDQRKQSTGISSKP
ncbi:MAG: hypothetical protein HYW62_04435 [Candidatus Levybacteria bacterium]|nr:hypothetical protein [Candidatus Levybacteria bacterium]